MATWGGKRGVAAIAPIARVVIAASMLGCGQRSGNDAVASDAAPAVPSAVAASTPSNAADAASSAAPAATTAPLSPAEQAVTTLLESYGRVESCLDRVPLVLHGEANRKILDEHYKKKNDCNLRSHLKIDVSDCKATLDGGYCYPSATWQGKPRETHYCVVKAPQGFLIDWRCTVAYNPVPLVAFAAQHMIGSAAPFRLQASLGETYKGEFAQALPTHYALRLRDREGKSVLAYVPRTTPDGQAIFEHLRDGKEHALSLELAYPPGSTDPGVLEVRRLLGLGHRERAEELAPSASSAGSQPAAPLAPSTAAPTAR